MSSLSNSIKNVRQRLSSCVLLKKVAGRDEIVKLSLSLIAFDVISFERACSLLTAMTMSLFGGML